MTHLPAKMVEFVQMKEQSSLANVNVITKGQRVKVRRWIMVDMHVTSAVKKIYINIDIFEVKSYSFIQSQNGYLLILVMRY